MKSAISAPPVLPNEPLPANLRTPAIVMLPIVMPIYVAELGMAQLAVAKPSMGDLK